MHCCSVARLFFQPLFFVCVCVMKKKIQKFVYRRGYDDDNDNEFLHKNKHGVVVKTCVLNEKRTRRQTDVNGAQTLTSGRKPTGGGGAPFKTVFKSFALRHATAYFYYRYYHLWSSTSRRSRFFLDSSKIIGK